MSVFDWSTRPAANAISDAGVPAQDGASARELPGLIRDVMAAFAGYVADQGGAIRTGGIFNAYVARTASGVRTILTAPAGVELLLPPGCVSASGTILPGGRRLRGVGRNGTATELRYTSASGPAIKSMGDGAEVADLLLTNPVTNSTAVAIQLADGVQNPRGQMVSRVRVVGFRDQLDVQSGEFWTATYLDFYNANRYGIRIRNGVHPDT